MNEQGRAGNFKVTKEGKIYTYRNFKLVSVEDKNDINKIEKSGDIGCIERGDIGGVVESNKL